MQSLLLVEGRQPFLKLPANRNQFLVTRPDRFRLLRHIICQESINHLDRSRASISQEVLRLQDNINRELSHPALVL